MPFPVVLLLALASLQTPNAPAKDALALLTEVSQRYADAKSYHIEAIEERTTSNDLERSWQKTLLKAIVMPDARYRYEGRSAYSAAIVVSDGTTMWNYHPNSHLYTQRPAQPKYPPRGIIPHEEMATMTAGELAGAMAQRAHRLKSATLLPDETITIDDKTIECYVIHYSESDFKTRQNDLKEDMTLWIEKSRKVVLKTMSQMESYILTESHGHIPIQAETTLIYPVVELDQQEPASSFTFTAPSDAKLVAEFPGASRLPEEVDLEGKPAPDLQLKSIDGKITTLSSFHGKPVFIEFWATWCAPCVDLMPDLSKLYAETAVKGLTWISIDSDEDAKDAVEFISREHIPWPNYHDADGSYGKAFHRVGIPLGVLVDAEGKVTFYRTGYEISDLRSAVAKLGRQFSSAANPPSSK